MFEQVSICSKISTLFVVFRNNDRGCLGIESDDSLSRRWVLKGLLQLLQIHV